MEHEADTGEREADDIGVIAFDAGDELGGDALDAVGAGLVEGLARGDVGIDHFDGHLIESDSGLLGFDGCLTV